MKLLFAASEAVPFIKTGGLGEVVGALSAALKTAGHDVRLILPKYRGLRKVVPPLTRLPLDIKIPIGNETIPIHVDEVVFSPRLRAYLVDSPAHFDRDGVYGDPDGREFSDNNLRFIAFSRAVLEIAKAIRFRPDVIHAHDWQTGLVPVYLATEYRSDPFFRSTASVFSIHNIAYQGIYPKETLGAARLSWTEFTPDKLEFYDQINFLKAGLAYAQVISTVSPTYALETQRETFGVGLDGFLKRRAGDYFGILNGLDTRYWNPQRDPHLVQTYSSKKWAPRAACKEDLQRSAGLDLDARAPLLGMVSRLDGQKGFDILLDILEDFIGDGCQTVFFGVGKSCLPGRASHTPTETPWASICHHRLQRALGSQNLRRVRHFSHAVPLRTVRIGPDDSAPLRRGAGRHPDGRIERHGVARQCRWGKRNRVRRGPRRTHGLPDSAPTGRRSSSRPSGRLARADATGHGAGVRLEKLRAPLWRALPPGPIQKTPGN